MNKADIVENLFGKTRNIDGNYVISSEEIVAPFKEKESVIRMFCANCGGCFEISRVVTDRILSSDKRKKEYSKKEYVEVDGCAVCGKDRTTVKLKKVMVH